MYYKKVYCLTSARGIARFIYLSAMLVGNMNRRELGHKCVAILRIVDLYILFDRLLFSLARDNTSVYNMTSEAPHEHEYLQFSSDQRNHLLVCLFTFRFYIYEWVHPAGRVRHNISTDIWDFSWEVSRSKF